MALSHLYFRLNRSKYIIDFYKKKNNNDEVVYLLKVNTYQCSLGTTVAVGSIQDQVKIDPATSYYHRSEKPVI